MLDDITSEENTVHGNNMGKTYIRKWKVEKVNDFRNSIKTDKVSDILAKLQFVQNDGSQGVTKADIDNFVTEVSDIFY